MERHKQDQEGPKGVRSQAGIVEWAGEVKGEEKHKRRLAAAVEWMAEGKPRNWKYIRKS